MPKDKEKIEDVLGEEEQPGSGEENPLEAMDEISNATPSGKKGSGSKDLDEDVVTEMLKTGENTDGMFIPKGDEDLEEEDESAKVKVGDKVKPSDKYKDKFKDDMLKHPDEYKLMTPRGEMTVAEALRAGYNPMTKTFDESKSQKGIKDKYMAGLNDADREAIEGITSPSTAQVAPADAEMYGLPSGSPLIRQEQPAQPAMPAGQMPAQGGTPVGAAMPGAEESMAPGGSPDIAALLGGGQ